MEPFVEWLRSPSWIGVGVALLLVLVVIIGIAARSHGPTVIKE